ncbi:hypothetical protein SUGI_1199440 [Cryptomeria japonica]|uniref:uncharacterized protein LOC131038098 n=1 Tax=Cryptomeria japonica TaxID=3369 RepID=UPI002414B663|nr:uncharacterized protein LOC131038098 [Cryptomeria japonica]GLJ55859.1 hypothetical protein SUGI_1199440 [Cryptomeria japonica]
MKSLKMGLKLEEKMVAEYVESRLRELLNIPILYFPHHTPEVKVKRKMIDLGAAQNLIAPLDSIHSNNTSLFFPSAEDLKYETPAMDLLSSSLGRSKKKIKIITEMVE